jgi:basic membrane protein A
VFVSAYPIAENDDFQLMGKTGTEQAGKKYGAEVQIIESMTPEEREKNLRMAADGGATLVITLASEFTKFLPQVATEHPDVQFLNVDRCVDNLPPNLHCAVFLEHEATFLLGATAALLTEKPHLGVISAIDIPFFHRFTDGFTAGARYITPDIPVTTRWVGGDNPFRNPERGEAIAKELSSMGIEHIFSAAGVTNYGVFDAAQEEKFFAYGAGSKTSAAAPGHIVENFIKRVDTALIESVDGIMSGTTENIKAHGLKSGGVGIVSLTSENPEASGCLIMKHPDVIEKLREIQQKIIAGEIRVEDPLLAQ